MSYTLRFEQLSATTAWMTMTYDLPGNETGSDCFTYHAAKPQDVIKETRLLTTASGKRIQCGIQLRNGAGYGVAWPA